MTDGISRKPSIAAVVLAALPPLVFPAMAFMLLLILVQATPLDSISNVIQNAGSWGFVVLGATVVAALLSVAMLVLAGLGRRVPAAAMIGVAAVPWVVGAVGMMQGMHITEEALETADSDALASLANVGVAEATSARTLGTTLGGALLAAVAVGLGVVAIGQRAPNRRLAVGGLIGFATGLAWLGAIAIAMQTRGGHEFTDLALLAAVPAVAGLFACLFACAGAGADEPNGKTSGLAVATPVAAMLACVAGAAAVTSIGTSSMLDSLARSDATDSMTRGMTVSYGISRIYAAELVGELALLLGVVPMVALAAWAWSRRKPSGRHLAGAFAVAAIACVVLLVDRSTVAHAEALVVEKNAGPGTGIAGFAPVRIPEGDSRSVRNALVASSVGVTFGREPPISWRELATEAGRARLAKGIRRQRIGAPGAAIALDRRVGGAQVRSVMRAVTQAGITRVDVVGPGEDVASFRDVSPQDLARALPVVGAVIDAPTHRSIALESSVPATAADADRTLLHATIRGASAPRLETRTGEAYEPVAPPQDCFGGAGGGGGSGPIVRAWIAFTDAASAADIVRAFARLERGNGIRALLVVGETIPGHPERPYVAPPTERAVDVTSLVR